MCSGKKKINCLAPNCEWKKSSGCKKSTKLPTNVCLKKSKKKCSPPSCEWNPKKGCQPFYNLSPLSKAHSFKNRLEHEHIINFEQYMLIRNEHSKFFR